MSAQPISSVLESQGSNRYNAHLILNAFSGIRDYVLELERELTACAEQKADKDKELAQLRLELKAAKGE